MSCPENTTFYLEYPCNSPDEERWFIMTVTSLALEGDFFFIVSHKDITTRKLAEMALLDMAKLDGLTDIANRRSFDEFLFNEWNRCARLSFPLSLITFDLDHFKVLNDTHGHQHGDECLKYIGKILRTVAKRPSDLCARTGGEEFAVILGNTSLEDAVHMAKVISDKICKLALPNECAPTAPYLTASFGVAEVFPKKGYEPIKLYKWADKALYTAKENGRNSVSFLKIDLDKS